MVIEPEEWLRLLAALVAGGMIGLEREYRDKAAGFRTLIFISVGAALFTIVSAKMGANDDPARIAAQIVTGVGFIGAGVILREGGHIVGLTTAAGIWLTAAIGTALGAGYYGLGAAVLAIAMIVLWVFPYFEHRVDALREARTYEIVCALDTGKVARLESQFLKHGLQLSERHLAKEGEKMRVRWHAIGKPRAQETLINDLLADAEILAVRY